jgi:ankyrin repeat protein
MPSPEKEPADDPLLHGTTLRDSAEPVSPDQLAQIERSLDLRLPDQYRSFLLRANGGVPDPKGFRYTVVDEEEGTRGQHKAKIARFYPAADLKLLWGFPDWLLPIAHAEDALEGGMLCIAVKGKQQGRIYYWPEQELGEEKLHRVADSFGSFLALLGKGKRKDADPAAGQKPRKLSLRQAAAGGQLEDVQRLLERGASPFEAYAFAADAGQAGIIRYLLNSGALKEVGQDALRFTQPKLWEDLEVVRGLVKAGADVKYLFFDGTTPLHWAAQHASPEVVKYLLDGGAKPGVWSRSLYQTALHRAVFDARDAAALAKMKLLLDAGEDLHARPPGPLQPPSDVLEHVRKRLGAAAAGLSRPFGSILNLSLNVNPSSQPGASAAELLMTHGRSQLLQELEQYLAQRRPARFAADERVGDD